MVEIVFAYHYCPPRRLAFAVRRSEKFGSCRSLIEFCIQSNRIEGEIPQSIGDLEELRFFEANNNLLACEMLEAFRVRANQLLG
jgi:hypothetical protein